VQGVDGQPERERPVTPAHERQERHRVAAAGEHQQRLLPVPQQLTLGDERADSALDLQTGAVAGHSVGRLRGRAG
jgi:hypothetical protein